MSHMTLPGLVLLMMLAPSTHAVTVDVPVDHYWDGIFQAYACVEITQPLSGWTAHLLFDADVEKIEVWDALQTKLSDRDYKLTNQQYNEVPDVGSTLCIYFRGFLAVKTATAPSISMNMEGLDDLPTQAPPSQDPSNQDPDTNQDSATVSSSALSETPIKLTTSNEWNGGFQSDPCIDIYTPMDGWTAHLNFGSDIDRVEVYVASATKVTPTHFKLVDLYGGHLKAGDRLCFSFVGHCTCTQAPDISIYVEGNIDPS